MLNVQNTILVNTPVEKLKSMLPVTDRTIHGVILKNGTFLFRDSGWNTTIPVVMGEIGILVTGDDTTVPCVMVCLAHVNSETSEILTLVPITLPSDPNEPVLTTLVPAFEAPSSYEPAIQLANDVLKCEYDLGILDVGIEKA